MNALNIRVFLATAFVAVSTLVPAGGEPDWWGPQGVLKTGGEEADDYAVANQGQLRNMVVAARQEFRDKHGNIDLRLIETAVDEILAVSDPDDYAAINLGQLKEAATPFYDVLDFLGYQDDKGWGYTYPWEAGTEEADDYAAANLGQLKEVFSFSNIDGLETPATDIFAKLTHAWPLDEQSGDRVEEHSGGSLDATESGTVGYVSLGGGLGNAADVDDAKYLKVADAAEVRFDDRSFSGQCLVRFDDLPSVGSFVPIVTKWGSSDDTREFVVDCEGIALDGEDLEAEFRFAFLNSSNVEKEAVVSVDSLDDEEVYHLAWSYDASADKAWLWVNDGTPGTVDSDKLDNTGSGAVEIQIGQQTSDSRFLDGHVSELMLAYDAVWTSEEVTWLYNTPDARSYWEVMIYGDPVINTVEAPTALGTRTFSVIAAGVSDRSSGTVNLKSNIHTAHTDAGTYSGMGSLNYSRVIFPDGKYQSWNGSIGSSPVFSHNSTRVGWCGQSVDGTEVSWGMNVTGGTIQMGSEEDDEAVGVAIDSDVSGFVFVDNFNPTLDEIRYDNFTVDGMAVMGTGTHRGFGSIKHDAFFATWQQGFTGNSGFHNVKMIRQGGELRFSDAQWHDVYVNDMYNSAPPIADIDHCDIRRMSIGTLVEVPAFEVFMIYEDTAVRDSSFPGHTTPFVDSDQELLFEDCTITVKDFGQGLPLQFSSMVSNITYRRCTFELGSNINSLFYFLHPNQGLEFVDGNRHWNDILIDDCEIRLNGYDVTNLLEFRQSLSRIPRGVRFRNTKIDPGVDGEITNFLTFTKTAAAQSSDYTTAATLDSWSYADGDYDVSVDANCEGFDNIVQLIKHNPNPGFIGSVPPPPVISAPAKPEYSDLTTVTFKRNQGSKVCRVNGVEITLADPASYDVAIIQRNDQTPQRWELPVEFLGSGNAGEEITSFTPMGGTVVFGTGKGIFSIDWDDMTSPGAWSSNGVFIEEVMTGAVVDHDDKKWLCVEAHRKEMESASISTVSQASPARVTLTAANSNLSDGQMIAIEGVQGMGSLNHKNFEIENLNGGSTEFDLKDIDSSTYDQYTSGGTIYLNNSGAPEPGVDDDEWEEIVTEQFLTIGVVTEAVLEISASIGTPP